MTPHELMLILQIVSALGKMQATTPQAFAQPPTFQAQQSLAETAASVIRCYHPTANYQAVQIVQAPWSQQPAWDANSSIELLIYWRGAFVGGEYKTEVALVQRDNYIRGILLGDTAMVPANNRCALGNWVEVAQPNG